MSLHFCAPTRILSLSLLALATVLPLQPASADPITFPHENQSDLRGILNALHGFRLACLSEAPSDALPDKLLPEGYRRVTFAQHLWGEDDGSLKNKIAILSKTGTEQGDWDAGTPYITLSPPSDRAPNGTCTLDWQRGWDYDENREDLAISMLGVLDAQISYRMEAVLRSPPESGFQVKRSAYGGASDWHTWCWDGKLCSFQVTYNSNPKRGIELHLSRDQVSR